MLDGILLNKYEIQTIANANLSFLSKSLCFGLKKCCMNTHMYTNIVFINHVKNNEKAFIYEERHSIDESLFSEVSSFSSLRSPADR